MQDSFDAVGTPPRGLSPIGRLLGGRTLPSLLARLGVRGARGKGGPLRLGRRVFAIRHADVVEVLRRDLDFSIAPVNASRIDAVNGGAFILGMDRSPELTRERAALYRALGRIDLATIADKTRAAARDSVAAGAPRFDAIADYARPIALSTASAIFGIAPANRDLFAEVVRAIFHHTFLNIGGDAKIEARALSAAPLMRDWFTVEIDRRRRSGDLGADLMGALLSDGALDDDAVRRTLGGMLVGSVDTTTSTFARVFSVVRDDAGLAGRMLERWRSGLDIHGYCLDALRRWPHNPILLREAAADTVLAGVEIKAGTRVIAWTQAAMQDPDAFPDPGETRPDRPMAAYLHFGGGLHPCAGRVVNAIQIPLLVGTLLDAGARPDGAMKWVGPFPDRMPVRIDRGAAR